MHEQCGLYVNKLLSFIDVSGKNKQEWKKEYDNDIEIDEKAGKRKIEPIRKSKRHNAKNSGKRRDYIKISRW